jgi:hypothetical protein
MSRTDRLAKAIESSGCGVLAILAWTIGSTNDGSDVDRELPMGITDGPTENGRSCCAFCELPACLCLDTMPHPALSPYAQTGS